ncbi:ABC transporter permease subunit [Rubrobacter tropicus]|uniref:ABC transporter permease subunit n=1 Tax=Rubrobacter tropicus TaxID=2653851 RepID=A0A6G8Q676_9ACTN|nr:sugar ABC transporter permease [Rubrobacter tropicus]QIN81953.1 ABC transporter permease subunit [Rubrobacter tropicus]
MTTTDAGPKRRLRPRGFGNYMFVLPAAVFLVAFMVYPILFNIQMSFRDMKAINLLGPGAPWVGFENYAAMLQNPLFLGALWNSVLFTVFSLVFQVGIGFALALFYNRPFPGNKAMRGLYLVAWTIPVVVSGAIFRWLLDGRAGVINWVLDSLGVIGEPVFWLTEPDRALAAVIFINIWLGIPFNLVLLLAGLQGIPEELYEAAAVDGATGLTKFRYVTLPLLRPALLATLVLGLIYTFKVFDVIWATTRGGPVSSTEVLPTLAYKLVFEQFTFGEGAAILNLMFVALFLFSLVYLWLVRREEAG